MKEALIGLFSSKKALAGMAATATTALILLAQKFGYGLDPESTKLLVSAVMGLSGVYILGQGAADLGKEKAKVETALYQVFEKAQKLPEDDEDQVLNEDA
ncbi:MAG: hypothetical protein AB7L09_00105 [Nitrospira sp.]